MFYIFSFGFGLKHYFIVENFHEKKNKTKDQQGKGNVHRTQAPDKPK
jgi:hypothetical protein